MMRSGHASSADPCRREMRRYLLVLLLGLALLAAGAGQSTAAAITLSNASFELPVTPFVNTDTVGWQKAPQPEWYPPDEVFQWDQLTGLFKNPDPPDDGHIANCDGQQAVWLFAVPDVGLSQDVAPQPASAGVFEAGHAYELTVGLIGLGGGMQEGVSLELGLYFRDDAARQVMVATMTITNGPQVFSNRTHFLDFKVRVPAVAVSDPWAGRPLGVRFLSTVGFELQGGYWVLDNVRLASFRPPALTEVMQTHGQIRFTLESEPGQRFEMLASTNLLLTLAEWDRLGVLTNTTGRTQFVTPATNGPACFFQARLLE